MPDLSQENEESTKLEHFQKALKWLDSVGILSAKPGDIIVFELMEMPADSMRAISEGLKSGFQRLVQEGYLPKNTPLAIYPSGCVPRLFAGRDLRRLQALLDEVKTEMTGGHMVKALEALEIARQQVFAAASLRVECDFAHAPVYFHPQAYKDATTLGTVLEPLNLFGQLSFIDGCDPDLGEWLAVVPGLSLVASAATSSEAVFDCIAEVERMRCAAEAVPLTPEQFGVFR